MHKKLMQRSNANWLIPNTDAVRCAVAHIIRDIQYSHDETDQQTADALGCNVATILRARNKTHTMDTVILSRIGAVYGKSAMAPIEAMYSSDVASGCEDPRPAVADCMGALARARGVKGDLDALPAVKDAIDALKAFVDATERTRLRVAA